MTFARLVAALALVVCAAPAPAADDRALKAELEAKTQALAEYVGRYELTPDIHYSIRLEGDRLLGVREDGREAELRSEAPDVFFVTGSPRSRKVFYRDSSGRVTGFGDRREGQDIKWSRLS